MLAELLVRNLGVIEDVRLQLGPGMTVLSGETGAGKTLIVEAIDLLVGGRPDAVLVRPGAEEAVVEGRFLSGDGTEVVLGRVVPSSGRSRAYVDGRMAPVSALAEIGAAMVDLHGQHAHQSLLAPAEQRAALDRFAGIDTSVLASAQAGVRRVDAALLALGGDARSRAREIDLLRFQVAELDQAALADVDEEASLAVDEEVLADADAHRLAGAGAYAALLGDGGGRDRLGEAVSALAGRVPFAPLTDRLRSVAAELDDIAADLRAVTEALTDDPARLETVRARRQLLRELRRKYGDTLADVVAFQDQARRRLADLASYEERAAALEAERASLLDEARAAARRLGAERRAGAPGLARAIEDNLHKLALGRARFEVAVGEGDPGDDVAFGLGANPGEPVLPLAKVASGGELSRTMLAARLVLADGPPTLVFDEVDAGVGGEAAVAVGRALASVAGDRQVLVVTHLAQVAAFSSAHVAITKVEAQERTVARARTLDRDERVVELSRMLSGRPDSASARQHASELLDTAEGERNTTTLPPRTVRTRRASAGIGDVPRE
jgi:DNA repair protein RecN (Recombination protein N)